MITTSGPFATKNAAMAKQPIYAFAIAGHSVVYTTQNLTALGVTSAPAFEAWLNVPQGAPQTVDVINGTSTIGELQCEIVDSGGSIRALVGAGGLVGAACTLSVGYPGLDWVTDFVPLHTYVIYKVNPSAGYNSWIFIARDPQVLTKKTVYLHPENHELLSADNPWYLSGTPAEIFQAVALLALGLSDTQLDRAALVALDSPTEGLYADARPFLFALTTSFEGQQFLEGEVFKPSGLYPVVLNTGQLSLRAMRPPAAGVTSGFTFNEDNMHVLPAIDRMDVLNEVVWAWDFDGSNYLTNATYLQATSISAFGRGNQWSVQSQGLQSERGASWFTQMIAAKIFKRFAGVALNGGAPTLSIQAFLMTLPVWVGDFVAVTHSQMPDVVTGALGVTNRIYEVIGREPDYVNGAMKYKLLDTGLTGSGAAFQWGAGSARPLVIGTGTWF